ncbi:unnamed protein product [Urochloa humidicola]
MAVEVVQFLVRKFADSLAEEAVVAAKLPFGAQFYDMRAELEKAPISPANADELRECLYELNDLLAECRMLTKRQNRRSFFITQPDAWQGPPVRWKQPQRQSCGVCWISLAYS